MAQPSDSVAFPETYRWAACGLAEFQIQVPNFPPLTTFFSPANDEH
jgi:hypothetical protein